MRRRGLGQVLVRHLLDWAQERGAIRVELQYIDGNLPAQLFWAALGFRPYARKSVYYSSRGQE
jgi:GNAT superfamily N-acetyltransferase